jgi:hypothetical protein
VTFCLAQRDLWWVAASPLYLLIGTTRHEGAHAAMAFALGGRIIDFSVLPSGGRMGYVDVVGGNPEWLWVAAPYLCDVLTFVIGYIWASKIQPASPPLDDVCLAFCACLPLRFRRLDPGFHEPLPVRHSVRSKTTPRVEIPRRVREFGIRSDCRLGRVHESRIRNYQRRGSLRQM